MNAPLEFIGNWGHMLAAGLFAALSIWTSRNFAKQRAGKLLAKTCHLLHGTSITTLCQGDNRRRSEQVTSHLLIAFTKTAAGNKRLHAVVFAAIATD